jgi:anti-anti-sigma factor
MIPLTLRATRWGDDGVHLELDGEIDMANVDDLHARILAELDDRTRVLVIDLARVTYLDTLGLRLLVKLAGLPQPALTVVAPPGSIAAHLLAITDLAGHLGVAPEP